MAEKKTPKLEKYLGLITSYEKTFKKWESRVDKIIRKYRDENRTNERGEGEVRFNILWSNVQTLVPATFSRIPKAEVSRRYRDQDQVGRVASLIIERALEYELQHYPDFRSTMKADVLDRFLGGRGTAWARYEPHIRAVQAQLPQDGAEITEDVDKPGEELDYECAPVDYVHWKDFGHTPARTWEEVPQVWRRVYMQMPAKKERFPEKADKIPKDAKPSEDRYPKQQQSESEQDDGSWIYELWDKTEKKVYWFHKSMKDILDERDDPLSLEDFYPCPKPLYATLTNDSLVPVPDFSLYQDQAKSLDTLADRIYGLVDMLQVKGVYDGSADKAIGRLFTEGGNGNLLPVKNWAAFAEKNGLKGSIDIVDLDPIARALKEAYVAFAQIIQFVYQITGIADIVRGVSDPNETLGAQEIKKNFVGLRLGDMKMSVAQFATEIIQLKAQIICTKFDPATILKIAAVDQLSPEDQALIPQAMMLLVGEERMMNPEASSPNPMRSFRIEVQADSLVQIDEQAEKENRMELLTVFGTYLEKSSLIVGQAPQTAPLVVEIGKYVLQSFKAGKNIEGTFDTLLEQLKQQAANPQPKVDPEMEKVKAEAQLAAQESQQKLALERQKHQDEMQMNREKHANDLQMDREKFQLEAAMKQEEAKRESLRLGMEANNADREHGLKEREHEDKIGVEKMRLRAETIQKGIKGVDPQTLEVIPPEEDPDLKVMQELVQSNKEIMQMLAQAVQGLTTAIQASMMDRETTLIRNPQTGKAEKSVSRMVRQ